MAKEQEAAAREKRFTTELALSFDALQVAVLRLPAEYFQSKPLPGKVEILRTKLEEEGVVGIIWLTDDGGDKVMMHFATTYNGRPSVRSVDAKRGDDVESELALATAELVNETYIFTKYEADPVTEAPPEPETIVPAPPLIPAPNPVPEPAPDKPPAIQASLGLFGGVGTAIAGHTGPSIRGTVGIRPEIMLWDAVPIILGILADLGPDERRRELHLAVRGVRLEFQTGYLIHIAGFSFGPVLNLSTSWNRTEITLDEAAPYTFETWNFRGATGVEMRLAFGRSISLFFGGDVGLWSRTETYRKQSDETVSYATAKVDWRALAGVVATIF